jgi:hypothetical protein
MTHQQLPLGDQDLRRRASTRLKQKRDFGAHLFIYLVVNGFLIGIWAFTGAGFSGRHSRCSAGASAGAERLGGVLAQARVRGPDPPRNGAATLTPPPAPAGRPTGMEDADVTHPTAASPPWP